MALLHLRSTNPKFSYAISKNPESGLLIRSSGHGKMFGFYPKDDEQTYSIYFKDSPTTVTFKKHKDENIEYMNVSRFNSAMFGLCAIGEFYSTLYKSGSEHDPDSEYEHEIEMPLVKLDRTKYVEIMTRYFEGFDVIAEEIFPKNYKVTIKTKRSLADLVNFAGLFFVLNVISNADDYFEGHDKQLLKYLTSMVRLEAPYFFRYVFKVNLIRSERKFKENKEILETYTKQKLCFEFGSTADQRLTNARNRTLGNRPFIEVGCGEGAMTIPLAKRAAREDQPFYAIDVDEECRNVVAKRAKRTELSNIRILDSFDALVKKVAEESEKTDLKYEVICIEVIEHMEKSEATALIQQVIEFCKAKARTLVITTPNYDFNQFYLLEGFRHDDHKFEFTETEFQEWVSSVADLTGLEDKQVSIFNVGDSVDEVPTTLGVQFMFEGELIA